MDALGFTLSDLYRVLLVMFRTGSLMMVVPVFGHVSIPRLLRIWFVIILSVLMLPSSVVSAIEPPTTMVHLTFVILNELAVGFLMGFAVIVMFSAVQFAGHIVGLQMGLAVANVIDPMGAGQISVIGEFYYLFSMLIFLTLNGHHFLIKALVRSFQLVPIGAAVYNPEIQRFLIDLTFMLFVVGIKLAAPVIITLFILNSVLGIVARTVPQMNVFIVGFPLSIGVGIAVIGVSFPFFYMVLNTAFEDLERNVYTIISLLR